MDPIFHCLRGAQAIEHANIFFKQKIIALVVSNYDELEEEYESSLTRDYTVDHLNFADILYAELEPMLKKYVAVDLNKSVIHEGKSYFNWRDVNYYEFVKSYPNRSNISFVKFEPFASQIFMGHIINQIDQNMLLYDKIKKNIYYLEKAKNKK